ncbi:hypothetical protein [Ensifer sesbaniae]|uniref:hypothetical protein n=1 Tax=Ensifer sesbaniae TaxID=1214071 RepID=UPI001569863C|nr:hypothetical protein [Ensifer sesbaniae]NRQ17481.1 Acyl-coenzyme A dehydrogenase [Ensifer sesbaniae]
MGPIGITVEGAIILTRNLMIFGKGAVRSHPHAEGILALSDEEVAKGLDAFDKMVWRHFMHWPRFGEPSCAAGRAGSSGRSRHSGKVGYWRQLSRHAPCAA